MDIAPAPAPHVIKMWEQWRLRNQNYEAASESESESENKIPGFDNDTENVENPQDSIKESIRRGCEAAAGAGDEEAMDDSSESFAFAIDDIFEQILGSVDKASLFRCRLVSHKWRAVSTKVLKREDICIRLFVSEDPNAVYSTFRSDYEEGPNKPALSKFMSFLNKTYTQGGSLTSDAFPCNLLEITDCSLNYPELQSLLDVYGEHLQNLYVCSEFSPASQCEANFIKQLEHLLCVQAPNLQRLTFKELKLKSATSAPASTSGLPKQTAQESYTVVEIKKSKPKLSRLTLKPASRNIIDSIVGMCPNLNQIDVDPHDVHFLIQPTNLFHFVRKFNFDGNLQNFGNFQLFEAAILMSPKERKIQNLPPIKCTALDMNFTAVAKDLDSREDMRLRLVRIISKILESSWDTLEHINFTCHTANTLRGLKWPLVLPKVERLYSEPNCYGSCGLEIFPLDRSFKIQDTFPKLKDMDFCVTHDNIKTSDLSMKRRLGPVTSVTDVEVTVLFKLDPDWEEVVDEGEQLRFYSENLLVALFPGVGISLKCAYI